MPTPKAQVAQVTAVTTEQVKELRDSTGISVMQCRNALVEAEGNMKKALAILKKTSSDIAEKKLGREVNDGAVTIKTKTSGDKTKAILLALLCETDFVSKNADFTNLLEALGEKALTMGAKKLQSEAKEMIDPVVQKTGENIQLGDIYEVEGETLGSYVHNGKIAVLVSLGGGSVDLARDIAMHIAAMKPEYMSEDDVTEDDRKTMLEVFQKEVGNIDKPEDIKKKILDGKLNTYFKEKTLTDQPFIKNGEQTVGQLLLSSKAKIKEVKRYSI
jgi:elongation factor Ts